MAETERFYMYSQKQDGWVMSYIQDSVLERQLSPRRDISNVKDGQVHQYWVIASDVLQKNLGLLHQLGYQLHPNSPIHPDGSLNRPDTASYPETASYIVPSTKTAGVADVSQDAPLGSQENPYDVSKLAAFVSEKIRCTFGSRQVWVVGELSGLKETNNSYYLYPKLIQANDDGSDPVKFSTIIPLSVWRRIMEKCALENVSLPKNGDKICALCEICFYEKATLLQLKICDIHLKYAQGEFLKQKTLIIGKLVQDGLFELNKNLPEPVLPKHIAVFSNKSAYGYSDFHKKLTDAKLPVCLTLFEIALQGVKVESTFLKALSDLQTVYGENYFDYAVIIRGGGDITDLAWFNNYKIAAAIARSQVKFMVAIGHDKDFTVLDEMLVRCMTPTDAAVRICNKYQEAELKVQQLHEELRDAVEGTLRAYEGHLTHLGHALCHVSEKRMHDAQMMFSQLVQHLVVYSRQTLSNREAHVHMLSKQLKNTVSDVTLHEQKRLDLVMQLIRERAYTKMDGLKRELLAQVEKLSLYVREKQAQKERTLDMLLKLVEARDPRVIMKQGFVCLRRADGKRVTHIEDIKEHEHVRATLVNGHLDLTVNTIMENDHGSC